MAWVSKSPIRHFKANSLFNNEQAGWIVKKFPEVKNLTAVRRAFRLKLFPRKPSAVPRLNVFFQRLVERFRTVAATRQCVPNGRQPMTPGDVGKRRVVH